MYIFKENNVIKGTARACPKSEEGEDIEGWYKAESIEEFEEAKASLEISLASEVQ